MFDRNRLHSTTKLRFPRQLYNGVTSISLHILAFEFQYMSVRLYYEAFDHETDIELERPALMPPSVTTVDLSLCYWGPRIRRSSKT